MKNIIIGSVLNLCGTALIIAVLAIANQTALSDEMTLRVWGSKLWYAVFNSLQGTGLWPVFVAGILILASGLLVYWRELFLKLNEISK